MATQKNSNWHIDIALCTIFTILLTLWNYEQKNRLLIKLFFVFHRILIKLVEIVVHMDNYNFTRFHQNQMKNKKVWLIACFSVQNFKVSVKLWKSFIVHKHGIYFVTSLSRRRYEGNFFWGLVVFCV